jgi:hypothetical protein
MAKDHELKSFTMVDNDCYLNSRHFDLIRTLLEDDKCNFCQVQHFAVKFTHSLYSAAPRVTEVLGLCAFWPQLRTLELDFGSAQNQNLTGSVTLKNFMALARRQSLEPSVRIR